jgi:hypothetical protein
MNDEIRKGQGSSGSGKSPTKFMERPGSKKPEKKEAQPEQIHPEFINDDLDALENQEKDDEPARQSQDWAKNKPKGDEKPDQRKDPDPEKRDTRSDDTGDCACP